MVLASHIRVPIIRLPKFATALELPICFKRRLLLPTLKNLCHGRGANFKQYVHMIWHNHPRAQFVPVSVEEKERVLDQFRDFRHSQITLTMALIEIRFQLCPPPPVILNCEKLFPFRSESAREGIGETERYELRQSGIVAMGRYPRSCQPRKPRWIFSIFGAEDQRRLPSTRSRTPKFFGGPGCLGSAMVGSRKD